MDPRSCLARAGRSRFTTWAHKVAVQVELSELRRNHWQEIALVDLIQDEGDVGESRWMIGGSSGPEIQALQPDMVKRLRRSIAEELTARQRKARVAR